MGQILKCDRYYMDIAIQVSRGSKCKRAQYGSVIVHRKGHIVATGYNGKPAGSVNDDICYREGLPPNSPKDNCCLHSEANAIIYAGKERCDGGIIYVSGRCCNDCALLIMQAKLSRLVFYDGETTSGHKGSSTNDYFERYGSKLEIVPFTYEEWNRLYSNE